MKQIPSCDDCGESKTILTQVSNFSEIKYLCSDCYKTRNSKNSLLKEENQPNNICEECKKEDSSVRQNLIKHSYKICNSCNISKTIFPV